MQQRCPEPAAPVGAPGALAASETAAGPAVAPAGTPGTPGAATTPDGEMPPGPPGVAEAAPPSTAPPPGAPTERSLPELTITNVGLHIGGGANDDASRAPFKRAIEARFDDFRRCYQLVEEPGKGGTYGADLFIGRNGGKPEVRQPRTGMKGAKFRECMLAAFGTIEFDKPKAGPTVISYSLRFDLAAR
jgi:hypothetical protein